MDDNIFLLGGIRVGLSKDKKMVKVDLYSLEQNEEDMPFSSFVVPINSYNTLLSALKKAEETMQADDAFDSES